MADKSDTLPFTVKWIVADAAYLWGPGAVIKLQAGLGMDKEDAPRQATRGFSAAVDGWGSVLCPFLSTRN